MSKWIKLEHNRRDGEPLLDTYINLDKATMIEYNHADDHFMISLNDGEDKVVIIRDYDEAYRTVRNYLDVIDNQRKQFKDEILSK
jgi:hypothetical protein